MLGVIVMLKYLLFHPIIHIMKYVKRNVTQHLNDIIILISNFVFYVVLSTVQDNLY